MRLRFKDQDYFPANGERPSHPGLALDDIAHFPEKHLPEQGWGLGARISASVLRRVENSPRFALRKVKDGGSHAVIFVNGFLSKGIADSSDWQAAMQDKYEHASWYHLDWDARNLFELLSPIPTSNWFSVLTSWHFAMKNAEQAGKLLAKAIVSTPGSRFTLAGHSLGARVIHFALHELSRQRRDCIDNAYLLGGAVGGGSKDDHCWRKATSAVSGKIYNCFSSKDAVLDWLYRNANARFSEPIGSTAINLAHIRIADLDCSELVSGHLEWKAQFGEILRRIDAGLGKSKNPLL